MYSYLKINNLFKNLLGLAGKLADVVLTGPRHCKHVMVLKNMMHYCRLKDPTVYQVLKMGSDLNTYGSKMQHTHECSSDINPKTSYMKLNHWQGAFYCRMSTFSFYTLSTFDWWYFYVKVSNAGLLLVMECFHSVILVFLLKESIWIIPLVQLLACGLNPVLTDFLWSSFTRRCFLWGSQCGWCSDLFGHSLLKNVRCFHLKTVLICTWISIKYS